jgi:hypothetical protein
MKLGALRVLHAVNGPRSTVSLEMFRLWRVPVAALVNRIAALQKLFDQLVQRRDDFVSVGHSQRSLRDKNRFAHRQRSTPVSIVLTS